MVATWILARIILLPKAMLPRHGILDEQAQISMSLMVRAHTHHSTRIRKNMRIQFHSCTCLLAERMYHTTMSVYLAGVNK
jgi:hypothetical protein